MSKIGFRFAAVPRDRHPEWFEVSAEARCLGLELFVTIYDEKTRTAEVAVSERWAVSLCKLLRIEAEERQGICRMLEALERRGLLVIELGRARIVFRADEQLGPRSPDPRRSQAEPSDHQADTKDTPSEVQAESKRRVTPSNDTSPVSQKEENRREETRGESARARVDDSSSLEREIRNDFEKRFTQAMAASPPQGALSKAAPQLAAWVEKTAPLRKLTEQALVKRMLDGFFANEKAKGERYPPGWLVQNPLEYADPQPLKSVVRAKYAGPSEVPTNPQDYAVPEGGVKW